MWHWLCKKVFGLDYTLRLSIGLASGLHLLFFIVCGLYTISYRQVMHINRHFPIVSKPVIIIDPTARTTGMQHVAKSTGNTTQKKAATPPPSQQVPVTSCVVTEIKPHNTNNNQNKTGAKKAEMQKPVAKKKIIPKKPDVKKPEVKNKKAKPAASDTKKELVPKKITAEKKKPETSKKDESPKKIDVPVVKKDDTADVVNPAIPILQDAKLPEGPILVARSSAEAAQFSLHMQIQEELLRVWYPPFGCDTAIACHVKVEIDTNGIVQRIEIIQPSGMLLFDVSARAALQQATWPRGIWGTTLELVLQ